ncbi:hypothetical protein FDB55_03385 [Clostridium botulinum]|nr:hypothetical protein [Clostridium botulinum]NFL41793.1 hypothetical protein [Clostridium botulinum]NFN20789.1 hypothetical protein [Clostridium botulinum]NFN42007.1 hypothetical protein [Clostridium botulinum]NFO40899.1 hypothetical protein [Clostridium botulinum]
MKLIEKNDIYAIYSYGYDEDNLDGIIKIYLTDPDNFEVIKETKDGRVGRLGTLRAINVLRKAIINNTLEDVMGFQS